MARFVVLPETCPPCDETYARQRQMRIRCYRAETYVKTAARELKEALLVGHLCIIESKKGAGLPSHGVCAAESPSLQCKVLACHVLDQAVERKEQEDRFGAHPAFVRSHSRPFLAEAAQSSYGPGTAGCCLVIHRFAFVVVDSISSQVPIQLVIQLFLRVLPP